jgi:F-type H+-transporting ATPase subunit delta
MATLTASLAAAVTRAVDADQVADDLFAVSGLLTREPALRRMLTELSLAPAAKSGLAREMLSGQVGEGALALVAEAAGLRWAAVRHLADALEQLGVIAVAKSAEANGAADALEDQLFAVQRLVADAPELRAALADPARTVEDKRSLMHELLSGRATAGVMRLVDQALAGTYRTFGVALEQYAKVVADNRDRLTAVIRSARPLAAESLTRVETALTEQYGRPVHANVIIDRTVVGGLSVAVGDDVIDGTVITRLEDAGRRLAG